MLQKESIKRFVECFVPISHCNLRCSYCYIIQQNRRDREIPDFSFSPEDIERAFSKERWGGTMLVNLCGAGETMMHPKITEIISAILRAGHFMNVTTNGTISAKFNEISRLPEDMLTRLCFSFSLHYVELKRTDNLKRFAENADLLKKAGCSVLVQLNLCDEYIECRDEIKKFCIENFGALPQLALTRREGGGFSIFSDYTDEEYKSYGREFSSPLFEFTCKNFNVKRKEFCYAGDWSFTLNLASGDLRSCYFSPAFYNIYKDLDEPVKILTVGNNCRTRYCVNSSHFMSLGVIPDIQCPSYAGLRDRPGSDWYKPGMKAFLDTRLYDSNLRYSALRKYLSNLRFRIFINGKTRNLAVRVKKKLRKIINYIREKVN